MRGIVEVLSGKLRGHKALVEPERPLRIGRTDRADLVIPYDPKIAGVHVELEMRKAACELRNVGRAEPPALNGEPTAQAMLAHGDWLRIGQTDFLFHYEALTAGPVELDEPEDPELLAARGRALEALRAQSEPLFAVLDAARSSRILELLRPAPDETRSLYEEGPAESLTEVAPYLAALRKDGWLLEALVREGWGNAWGVFLTSKQSFKDVRTHLRRFLMVEDEESGEELYLRFYDPRVLRVLWPTCTARQKGELLGELRGLFVEDELANIQRLGPAEPRHAALQQES
jgi:hypothetical protein